MKTILRSFIGLALMSLTACSTPIVQSPDTKKEPAQSSSQLSATSSLSPESELPSSDMRETKNVTYRGIVQPSGISIFMQGTHRLVLSDGRFILLESDSIDLNGYVGEEVDISGAIRPTVEVGGQIMRAEEATLVVKEETEASSSAEAEPALSETTESSAASSTSSSSSVALASSKSSSSSSSSAPSSEAQKSSDISPEMEATVSTMAKEDFSAEQWTQEYCSGHIGFCFPVHRNWWYKSFGATTSVLWHIEVSNGPVLNLGDGPIVINLLRGPLTGPDLTVSPQGNSVIGFRQWSADQHFEISADKRLEAAVAYIMKNLTTYQGE